MPGPGVGARLRALPAWPPTPGHVRDLIVASREAEPGSAEHRAGLWVIEAMSTFLLWQVTAFLFRSITGLVGDHGGGFTPYVLVCSAVGLVAVLLLRHPVLSSALASGNVLLAALVLPDSGRALLGLAVTAALVCAGRAHGGWQFPLEQRLVRKLGVRVVADASIAGLPLLLAHLGSGRGLVTLKVGDADAEVGVLLCLIYVLDVGMMLLQAQVRGESSIAKAKVEHQRVLDRERTRIARELHDVVAHQMSVVVVQSQAASAVLAHDPDRAATALQAIERTSREALVELRRLLGVLRSPSESPSASQPTLLELDALAATVRDAGVAVDLSTSGDLVDVPAAVALSAYRIVQEALTNVVKHAGEASVRVTVDVTGRTVAVSVVDDGGSHGRADLASTGSGSGLVGMRERATVFGGTLEVGPDGSGWSVQATLPTDGVPQPSIA